MENKMKMTETLRAELVRLGWNPERIIRNNNFGERISGSPSHITLLTPAGRRYFAGPLVAIKDPVEVPGEPRQCAVVRMG